MSALIIQQTVMGVRDSFNASLSDKSVVFEAEAQFAIQALSTDFAMRIAMGNKQSVIDAVTNVAAIGISLNPAKKQAYLVPRDGKICLDISYMGLIDLAVSTGSIKWAQANVVYSTDEFVLRGFDEAPIHNYKPFGNRGEVEGVYVVVKTADNEYLTHTMSKDEVFAIRDRASQSFKGGKSSPWKTDEIEMIKKTCVKQAYKYWPKVDRLQEAIHHLNTVAGEGLASLAPTRNPNQQITNIAHIENLESVIEMLEGVAKNGTEALKVAWNSISQDERSAIGIAGRDRIKKMADEATAAMNAKAVEGEPA
jgi:recombination protein RecT